MKAQVVGLLLGLLSLLAWDVRAVTAGIVEAGPKEVEDVNNIVDAPEAEETNSFIKIGDYCYRRTKLFELPGSFSTDVVINKMGVLRTQRLLYYSYLPPLSDLTAQSYVGYVSLDDPSSWGTVPSKGPEKLNYSAFDINHRHNKIYLGSANGIWVIDEPDKTPPAVRLEGALHYDIVNLVSKDYVYFTRKDFPGIIKNKNGDYQFILNGNEITKFIVDKDVEYNVVYLNRTGLYAFNSKTAMEVKLHKDRYFRGITLDSDGVVYAWNAYGLHQVVFNQDFPKSYLKKISDLVVFDGGLTFDFSNNNNILYHEGKLLYELSNTYKKNC